MNETRTLWQRCEALGQFEDYKDDHVEMKFSDGRWLLESDGFVLAFIYPDRVNGSEWLAASILCHIERIRIGEEFVQRLKDRIDAKIVRLPDVTYVVEAPKQTEPTQEQLKAIWDYVTHLTGEQAESFGFQYAVIGLTPQPRFELKIETLQASLDPWLVTIIHTADGEFIFSSTYSFAGTCSRLGCFDIARGIVTESPGKFVSIPVQDWQEVLEAFMSLGKVLNSHTA